jgi:hypothetical protein
LAPEFCGETIAIAVKVWLPLASVPGVPDTGFATPENWKVPVIGGLLLAPVTVTVMLALWPKLMVVGFAIAVAVVPYTTETPVADELAGP